MITAHRAVFNLPRQRIAAGVRDPHFVTGLEIECLDVGSELVPANRVRELAEALREHDQLIVSQRLPAEQQYQVIQPRLLDGPRLFRVEHAHIAADDLRAES